MHLNGSVNEQVMTWTNGTPLPKVDSLDYLGFPLSKKNNWTPSTGFKTKSTISKEVLCCFLDRALPDRWLTMVQGTIMRPWVAYSAVVHRPTTHLLRMWRSSFGEAFDGNRLGIYLAIVFNFFREG